MITINRVFRIIMYFIFNILVFYSLKLLVSYFQKNKQTENFSYEKCNTLFTANGSEVTIEPVVLNKFLSISKFSNDITLKSVPRNSWALEKILERNNKDEHNDDGCSVFIKTSLKNEKINYYLTQDPKNNNFLGLQNDVSASLFGRSSIQKWYVFDWEDVKALFKINFKLPEIPESEKDSKYVFITTGIIDPINPEIEKPKYFTLGNNLGKNAEPTFVLSSTPTLNSVWKLTLTKKGKIEPVPDYDPISSKEEFPNKENKTFASFLHTYLPLWNRTWYSSTGDGQKSFTVNLDFKDYKFENWKYRVKETFATGTVQFDNNFTGSLKGASYTVRTQGSDMAIGKNEKDNSTIILRILPQSDVPLNNQTLPRGLPVLKGWVEKEENGKSKIISICASNEKNLDGVCISTKDNKSEYHKKFQNYLIEKDFSPIDPDTKFNTSSKEKTEIEGFDIKGSIIEGFVGNLSRFVSN